MQAVLQILINSFVSGLIIGLVAIGFTYIFRVTKVFHLAHGGVYVVGAFSFLWILRVSNNWIAAIVFSIAIVIFVIFLIEKAIYLPLNNKQSNQSISLIASMGLYIILINSIGLIFGNENKTIDSPLSGAYNLGDIILTKVQILQAIIGLVICTAFLTYMKISKSNLSLQAISDNETVSKVFGVNTEKERVKVFIAGSIITCIAAILKTFEIGIDPLAGMSITLTSAVVAILISRLNVLLIIVFAILLTLLQNTIEWFLNPQWKDGITFLILLLVILFRTEGIISYNIRKDRA